MIAKLPQLQTFFERYEALVQKIDAAFARVRTLFPQEVCCKEGCASCCHALFDLSLIETLYLNSKFYEIFPSGMEQFRLLEQANTVDRKLAKIKKQVYRDSVAGKESNAILHDVATLSVPCPLLDEHDLCLLYQYRPITCRVYGIPTSIGGKGHTCGKTGFVAGEQYPTVFLDTVQQELDSLSQEVAAALGSAYTDLASMYVPVSTALITQYDTSYLGIGGIPKEETK